MFGPSKYRVRWGGGSLRQKLAQVRDAQVGVRARPAYPEQVSLFHKRLEIGPGRRVDDSVRLSVPRDGELGFGVEHGPAQYGTLTHSLDRKSVV